MTTAEPFDFSTILWQTTPPTTFVTSTTAYNPFAFSGSEATATYTPDSNSLGYISIGSTIPPPMPTSVDSNSNPNCPFDFCPRTNDPPSSASHLTTEVKLAIAIGVISFIVSTVVFIWAFLRWRRWRKQKRAAAGAWGGDFDVSEVDRVGGHVCSDGCVGGSRDRNRDKDRNEKRVVKCQGRVRRGESLPPPTYDQAVGGKE